MELQQNHTLYINNLDDKLKKMRLKRNLHALFSRYGHILDIVACKGDKLRGQVSNLIDCPRSKIHLK